MSNLGPKSRLTVLRGGPSEEYDVSMKTGANVLEALAATDFQVDDIIISRSGEWLKNGLVKNPETALSATDVVFIALHGAYGEDGVLQRALERLAVPYVGSGPYASTLSFNKILAKEHLTSLGFKMPRHLRVSRTGNLNYARLANTIETLFGPHYVLKPTNSGASFGVRYVNGLADLAKALETIMTEYEDVLVEERIFGVPVTCGVLENFRDTRDYAFPVVQYDITADEVLDVFTAPKIVPAGLRSEVKTKVAEVAKRAHKALGCSQYSRSDFVVNERGEVYFLELNTLPSLSTDAPYIAALESVGTNLTEVLTHLVKNTKLKK